MSASPASTALTRLVIDRLVIDRLVIDSLVIDLLWRRTMTPRDYIEKSLREHPNMLAQRMAQVGDLHASAAEQMIGNTAAWISAISLRDSCYIVQGMASDVAQGLAEPKDIADLIVKEGIRLWVPAFNAAARLNLVGRMMHEIVALHPDGGLSA